MPTLSKLRVLDYLNTHVVLFGFDSASGMLTVEYTNAAMIRMLGDKSEAALNSRMTARLAPKTAQQTEQIRTFAARHLHDGRTVDRARHTWTRADGSSIQMIVTCRPVTIDFGVAGPRNTIMVHTSAMLPIRKFSMDSVRSLSAFHFPQQATSEARGQPLRCPSPWLAMGALWVVCLEAFVLSHNHNHNHNHLPLTSISLPPRAQIDNWNNQGLKDAFANKLRRVAVESQTETMLFGTQGEVLYLNPSARKWFRRVVGDKAEAEWRMMDMFASRATYPPPPYHCYSLAAPFWAAASIVVRLRPA